MRGRVSHHNVIANCRNHIVLLRDVEHAAEIAGEDVDLDIDPSPGLDRRRSWSAAPCAG